MAMVPKISASPSYNPSVGLTIKGGITFPRPFVVPGVPRMLGTEDSHMVYVKNNASATDGLGDDVDAIDGLSWGGLQKFGQAGTVLLKSTSDEYGDSRAYMLDDTVNISAATRSTHWATFTSGLTTPQDENDLGWRFGGTNNVGASATILTTNTTDYKAAMTRAWELEKEDNVNIQARVLDDPPRAFGGTHNDRKWINLFKANQEWIAATPDAYKGASPRDLDLRDPAHLTDAANVSPYGNRIAQVLGYLCGKLPLKGTYGVQVSSAVLNFDHLDMTLDYSESDGDDVTVDSGAFPLITLDDGMTLYTATSVSRVDANTVRAYFEDGGFDPNDITELHIARTSMNGLAQTSAPYIKDNGTLTLPIQNGTFAPTITDPLAAMNPNAYLIPSLADKTFSGSDVTAITDSAGMDWTIAANNYPEYDEANRRLTSPDTVTSMRTDAIDFSGGEALVFLVFYLPSSYSNFQPFSFGLSSGGNTNAALAARTSEDELWWLRDQSGTFPVLSTDTKGEKFVMCIHQKNNSEMDVYCNSLTPVSFDPNNAIENQDTLWLFGLKSGNPSANGMYVDYFWARNSKIGEGDTPIADCLEALTTKYLSAFVPIAGTLMFNLAQNSMYTTVI